MDGLTDNQRYHLILADIAMAAAIKAHDPDAVLPVTGAPGSLRDAWLAMTADQDLLQRVKATANAGMQALERAPADRLVVFAETYGIALAPEEAGQIARHFTNRRDAVLTYRR